MGSPALSSAPAPRKSKILFVDDEQLVLNGLENILRRQRRLWEMKFVVGGEVALETLAREHFDVVVTDMRMPGMNGAELLERIKALHPEILRLILSGQAEPESVLRAVTVAQQFLSKPCDIERLRMVLEASCGAMSLLADLRLRERVGTLARLPTAPATAPALLAALSVERPDVASLTNIVGADPALALKVLQLTNSAFFGLASPTCSLSKSIQYLGFDTLKDLVSRTDVFAADAQLEIDSGLALDEFRFRAYAGARMAFKLTRTPELAEEAFSAGLLRDVGRLALAAAAPAEYQEALDRAFEDGISVGEAERLQFGACHAEVGAYVLAIAGVPGSLVQTTRLHHAPVVMEGATPASLELLAAVHIGASCGDAYGGGTPTLAASFLAAAGYSPDPASYAALALQELGP